MIKTLRLRNFKCFDDATFDLGRITLLAGLNGTGKSSVIQGLLALRKFGSSSESQVWYGPLIDIGSFGDVLYAGAEYDQIELRILVEDGTKLWSESGRDGTSFYWTPSLSWFDQDDRQAEIDPIVREILSDDGLATVRKKSLLRESMFYLSADRLGPRKTLPFRADDDDAGTPLGKRGEHVLWFLGQHEGDIVAPALRRPGTASNTLADQANAWLATVSPDVGLAFRSVPEADLAVAGYSFKQKGDVRTRPFRATNVGFGVSYALPPIVALLAAQDDDLVIIENPEAHLHPGGQTSIAELAARAAADGRQVILETHSDHVLDGIRLAVAEQVVSAEDVAIYFFRRDDAGVQVTVPKIHSDGSLDSWPEGFFDQQERNLARLIGLRQSAGGDS